MLRIWISLFFGLMLTASLAMAQTTDPVTPAAPVAPVAGGGAGDWWWLILVVALIAVAIWYFMRKRGTTGRI